MNIDSIRRVDLDMVNPAAYKKQLADCVVLCADGRLLLQRRPENWRSSLGVVNIFGGHVEAGETAQEAVIRELNEETGGVIRPDALVFIGAVTEEWTGHSELVHVYFWHDRDNTVTGCYEAEAIYFDTMAAALAHPKLMDYARWALLECAARGCLAPETP